MVTKVISYSWTGDKQMLDECWSELCTNAEDYIFALIDEGFTEGELHEDIGASSFGGWWSVSVKEE